MSVFVSGATGYIGIQLVKRLAGSGTQVHALYRSKEKARLITLKNVKLFKGDILDRSSLETAMKDCQSAYHVAAFAGVSATASKIHELNVEGALNVLRIAQKLNMNRVVVTSTAGILGPSRAGEEVDENTSPPDSFFTSYEHSKYILEQELKRFNTESIEIIIVNPTRVYGPGLLSESNGVTSMIKKYIKNNWRYLPGSGNQCGNYVFVEDIVTGHLLAMEKGEPGERYLLGGENLTYLQLFGLVREASGCKRRLFRIPLWLMLFISQIIKILSSITGRPPLIVPELVRKFNHHWRVSSEKAIRELGYTPVSAREGIERTVQWINQNF